LVSSRGEKEERKETSSLSLSDLKMRITKRDISSKNSSGYVILQADDPEDMWHLYNLMDENDILRAGTIRNVVRESNTGSTNKSKIKITLTIRIERIEFDHEQCSLRITGRNIEENEHVKVRKERQ
jgi:protein pelota